MNREEKAASFASRTSSKFAVLAIYRAVNPEIANVAWYVFFDLAQAGLAQIYMHTC
jgi:hypothetical protein